MTHLRTIYLSIWALTLIPVMYMINRSQILPHSSSSSSSFYSFRLSALLAQNWHIVHYTTCRVVSDNQRYDLYGYKQEN